MQKIEGVNLIVTNDEKDGGTDMAQIEKLIQDQFFLGDYKKTALYLII